MTKEKALAKEIIKKYKTNDPFELCELMNIQVEFTDLGTIKGYYTKERRMQFIRLNNNLVGVHRKIVCFHEAGHSILHPNMNTPFFCENTLFSKNKYEIEANAFAVEMMLPDNLLKEFHEIYCYSLEQISIVTGIPLEILKYKCLE